MSKTYARITFEDGSVQTIRSKKKITEDLVAKAVKIECFTPLYVKATETYIRNEGEDTFRIERHKPISF